MNLCNPELFARVYSGLQKGKSIDRNTIPRLEIKQRILFDIERLDALHTNEKIICGSRILPDNDTSERLEALPTNILRFACKQAPTQ